MTCRAHRSESDYNEAVLALVVTAGGGQWVGIQHLTGREDLILFNAPSGTTLSLPVAQISPEEVARRIQESEERARTIAGEHLGRPITWAEWDRISGHGP